MRVADGDVVGGLELRILGQQQVAAEDGDGHEVVDHGRPRAGFEYSLGVQHGHEHGKHGVEEDLREHQVGEHCRHLHVDLAVLVECESDQPGGGTDGEEGDDDGDAERHRQKSSNEGFAAVGVFLLGSDEHGDDQGGQHRAEDELRDEVREGVRRVECGGDGRTQRGADEDGAQEAGDARQEGRDSHGAAGADDVRVRGLFVLLVLFRRGCGGAVRWGFFLRWDDVAAAAGCGGCGAAAGRACRSGWAPGRCGAVGCGAGACSGGAACTRCGAGSDPGADEGAGGCAGRLGAGAVLAARGVSPRVGGVAEFPCEAELVLVIGLALIGQVDLRGRPAEVHGRGGWGLGRGVFWFLAVLRGGDAQRGVVVRCFRCVGFFARLRGQRGRACFDEAAALACGWLGWWRAAVACAVSGILGNVWGSHRIHLRRHWVRFLTRNALDWRVFAACDGFYTVFVEVESLAYRWLLIGRWLRWGARRGINRGARRRCCGGASGAGCGGACGPGGASRRCPRPR